MVALLALGASGPTVAHAQRLLPELRAEGVFATRTAWIAGGGASVSLARSVQVAALGMAAVARARGAERARVEVIGRFLLDPDRQSRTSVYVGGGAAAVLDDARNWTGMLAVMVGAELGRRDRWDPFVEGGLGGGVRVAVGVRWR